jgi:hypothetical protein
MAAVNVVTVDELQVLRRRRAELGSVTSRLQRLGHDVPAGVASELEVLDKCDRRRRDPLSAVRSVRHVSRGRRRRRDAARRDLQYV